jgi:hypothetical protein
MQVVQQTSTNLMLQNRPVGVWILGEIAAAIGFSFVLASAWPTYLMGGFWIAFANLTVFLSPVETSTFDKVCNRFTLKQQGWRGTKVIEHAIQEIFDVRVEESVQVGSRFYRVSLVLASGKHLYLIQFPTTDFEAQQVAADCIRAFLALSREPVR